jgi:hypothetical protein
MSRFIGKECDALLPFVETSAAFNPMTLFLNQHVKHHFKSSNDLTFLILII